jgi:hypothetical protein
MNHKSVYLAIAMGLCVASVPVDVHAQKQPVDAKAAQLPDFIYQGRLEDGGALADGVYDLEFRLFDAATGGAQVGATISETDFPVMDGLFTINLAFPGAFVGQQLFLQVTIDGVTLPRQPISTAPVAQFALSASTATTADFASTAGTATTATTATTADSASTAGFATTAGSATSATTADFATTAGSAMTATSATNATQLGGVAGSHFARLYGDGSAGDLTVAASTPLQATNTSYHNITISAGTLTIPSGTLLRCTGSFTLAAGAVVSIQTSPSINTLLFNPASRVLVRDGAPGIGLPPGPPDSRTSAATALIATPGGPGLGLARARGLREIGPYGGAGGPSVALENVHRWGGRWRSRHPLRRGRHDPRDRPSQRRRGCRRRRVPGGIRTVHHRASHRRHRGSGGHGGGGWRFRTPRRERRRRGRAGPSRRPGRHPIRLDQRIRRGRRCSCTGWDGERGRGRWRPRGGGVLRGWWRQRFGSG